MVAHCHVPLVPHCIGMCSCGEQCGCFVGTCPSRHEASGMCVGMEMLTHPSSQFHSRVKPQQWLPSQSVVHLQCLPVASRRCSTSFLPKHFIAKLSTHKQNLVGRNSCCHNPTVPTTGVHPKGQRLSFGWLCAKSAACSRPHIPFLILM